MRRLMMSFNVGDIVLNGITKYFVTAVVGTSIEINIVSTGDYIGQYPAELFNLVTPVKPKEPYEDVINKIRHIKQKRLAMGYTT